MPSFVWFAFTPEGARSQCDRQIRRQKAYHALVKRDESSGFSDRQIEQDGVRDLFGSSQPFANRRVNPPQSRFHGPKLMAADSNAGVENALSFSYGNGSFHYRRIR